MEVVNAIKELLGSRVEPEVTQDFRPGDNRHDFADIARLKRDFGEFTFTPLDVGLKELAEWSSKEEALDLFEKEEKERKRFTIH